MNCIPCPDGTKRRCAKSIDWLSRNGSLISLPEPPAAARGRQLRLYGGNLSAWLNTNGDESQVPCRTLLGKFVLHLDRLHV